MKRDCKFDCCAGTYYYSGRVFEPMERERNAWVDGREAEANSCMSQESHHCRPDKHDKFDPMIDHEVF